MNLAKLFEVQKVLRDRINYNEPDRFNKLVLALLVELGECANEWRGFKFWSNYQEPRTLKCIREPKLDVINGIRTVVDEGEFTNPLLEEYVDGLHFVLELGIENGWTPVVCDVIYKAENVTMQLLGLYEQISIFRGSILKDNYYNLVSIYIGIGEMLGFTGEQIEESYYEKNRINHERQENGY